MEKRWTLLVVQCGFIERKEFLYIFCLISVVCNLLVWFDLFYKKNIRRTSDRMVKKVVGLLSASEYGGKIWCNDCIKKVAGLLNASEYVGINYFCFVHVYIFDEFLGVF